MNFFESLLAGPLATWFAGDSTSGVVGTLTGFFDTITDPKLWRSLGWLLLGIIILAFGLTLLLRQPIENAVGTAAKAVAL